MTQLSGHAAADTHRRLTRAVAALRAFSRRRAGRPAAVPSSGIGGRGGGGFGVGDGGNAEVGASPMPTPAPAPQLPSLSQQSRPPAIDATDESGSAPAEATAASAARNDVVQFSPLATLHAPLLATDGSSGSGSSDPSEDRQSTSALIRGSGYGTPATAAGVYNSGSSGSSDGNPLMEAWAAAESAAEATKAAERASAAAEAAAISAAASASVAAEGAVLAEHNSIAEALEEIRGALLAGREDAAGAGAEVERVAAGVGLAPALLRALRALRRRDDDGGGGGGGGRSSGLRLAKEVNRSGVRNRGGRVSRRGSVVRVSETVVPVATIVL